MCAEHEERQKKAYQANEQVMIELSVLPETIKPAIGYVIVEVPYLTKDSKDNFDLQLLSDIAIGDYTVRSGIVYSCGTTDVPHFNFSHESPLQVEKGDRVWWMPNAVQQIANSRDEQYRVLKHGNRLFLSIPYKMLVMREMWYLESHGRCFLNTSLTWSLRIGYVFFNHE